MSERDITERLTKSASVWKAPKNKAMAYEAAQEIKRLRQQNEDLMVMVHGETEKVAALTARCAELEKALEPFAKYAVGTVNADGWLVNPGRINDWFGPSDFFAARATLQGQDNG